MIYKMQFEWNLDVNRFKLKYLQEIVLNNEAFEENDWSAALQTLRSHLCGVFLTFPARSTPAWRSAPPACKCLEIWLWYQRDISSENLIESRYETAVNDWGPHGFILPSSRTSESFLFVYQLWGALTQHIRDAVTVTNNCNITHTCMNHEHAMLGLNRECSFTLVICFRY